MFLMLGYCFVYDWENWLVVGFYIGSSICIYSRLLQKHQQSNLLQGIVVVPKAKIDKLITV